MSLYRSWHAITKSKPNGGRIFLTKATILLSQAKKNRNADHLTNLVPDRKSGLTDEQPEANLDEARKTTEDLPTMPLTFTPSRAARRAKLSRIFPGTNTRPSPTREKGLFDEDVEAAST